MDIHSYDTSNHVVCMCVQCWRSQQSVSSEEITVGAETCLANDLFRLSWHSDWCTENIAQPDSHQGILVD